MGIRGSFRHFVFRVVSLVRKTECLFISYFPFSIVPSIFDNFIQYFPRFSLFFLLNIQILFSWFHFILFFIPFSIFHLSIFRFSFSYFSFSFFLFSLFLFLFPYTVFLFTFFSFFYFIFSLFLFLFSLFLNTSFFLPFNFNFPFSASFIFFRFRFVLPAWLLWERTTGCKEC